jgi:hypothetical protein
MKIVLETTKWSDSWIPNHVYVLNDSQTKMLAYVPAGSRTLQKFSKPMGFDQRGRTFVELKDDSTEKSNSPALKVPVPDSTLVTVKGSKGNIYVVNLLEKTCTCPGFVFRSHCKHIDATK